MVEKKNTIVNTKGKKGMVLYMNPKINKVLSVAKSILSNQNEILLSFSKGPSQKAARGCSST